MDTVILAGTTTPNCIRTSCYDALSLDYDAIVLSDCTSSVTEEVQRANLGDMERIGAQIETVEGLKSSSWISLEAGLLIDELHGMFFKTSKKKST